VAKGIVKGVGSGGMAGIAPVPPPPPPPPPGSRGLARDGRDYGKSASTERAAIVEISDAGRAALAAAQPPTPRNPGGTMLRETTTGVDWDFRTYAPGATHWGNASRASAAGASSLTETTIGIDQYETTSPGHKSVEPAPAPAAGDLGGKLSGLAHEAAHTIQQAVRVATGDLDGDGRADVASAGPPAGDIQQVQKARHDAAMAAIQNIR